MAHEETIRVCTKILENWKEKDRTAFIDSVKELNDLKQYTNEALNQVLNVVDKVVKELSNAQGEKHEGYMEQVLDLKKKLREKQVLLKKKEISAKKQGGSKNKQQSSIPEDFAKDLPQSRRKFAKHIYSCFVQNFDQKYDPKVLETFIVNLEKEINDMFEGDATKIVKHLGSLKINLISPKSKFAKSQMLEGSITPKEVATNKTAVFEDRSATKKKLTGDRPDDKEQELTGNGEQCIKCQAMQAYCYMMQQIRASDEPMTRFLRCRACKDTWTD